MELEDCLRESKKIYRNIPVPEEARGRIEAAYRSVPHGSVPKPHLLRWVAASAAAAFAVFVILLNSSPVFARSARKIPVLGSVARVFTFREDFVKDVGQTLTVREPAVSGLSSGGRQEEINRMIRQKVAAARKMLEERSAQEREAFLQTGGKAEDYVPAESSISYSVKCNNGKVLSFVLDIAWDRAQSYSEQDYYNLDPGTGKALTLEGLLGKNYKAAADASIRSQMKERCAQHPDWTYFTGDQGFQGIGEKQKFYVNAAGRVVAVFDKYEIAPGFMGPQEFEIQPEAGPESSRASG